MPEPGLKSEIQSERGSYRIFWKHLVSTRRVIRHPSAVRTKSSSYHKPQNMICSFSPPRTIGLKQIVRDDAAATSIDMVSFIDQFFDAQRQVWKDSGGSAIHLPEADQKEMLAKISSIAEDLSTSKPDLNAAVKAIFAATAKNK